MKRLLEMLLVVLCLAGTALADAGVLIPRDKSQPDPAILSLDEMEIHVSIDNGVARVYVRQIFGNHTGAIEEGNYIFALPSRATVSDFAVWDGPTRIPAVILERKRASKFTTRPSSRQLTPACCRWASAESKRRGAVRRSARGSFPFLPMAPSALSLNITRPFPSRT